MLDPVLFGVCAPGSECEIEIIDGVSPVPDDACGSVDFYYYADLGYPDPGRWFYVQGSCAGFISAWGRYAVCEQDRDCPQLLDPSTGARTTTYSCHEGFCQDLVNFDADDLPDGWDMLWICAGDGPRFVPEATPSQELHDVVDAACPERDEPCNYVPDGCSYPRN